MMRGVGAGMPIKAVGVTLQQSPMAFIYRADAARPTKISEIKGSRIAITAGDASLAIFTAFMGKLGMKVEDVQMITVANPAAKEQAVLNKQADALLGYFMDQGPRMQLQTGVKMGWTRLYDMAGVTTLSSAIIANNDWVKDAKNQDTLRRFLRASQRGWQYSFDNRDEAAEIFRKAAPVFTQEIALLEVDGTMTIIRTERTKGKPIAWSDAGDWKDSQDLLEKFAKLKPQPDVNVYFTNELPVRSAVPAEEVMHAARPAVVAWPGRGTAARNPMAQPYIRLQNVGKVYDTKGGAVEACVDVNLDIRQSEFVAIVGPSGCGKTTIMKMVAGLVPYTSGTITVGGSASTRPQTDVGIVFQDVDPARLARRAVERDAADRHPAHGPGEVRAGRARTC